MSKKQYSNWPVLVRDGGWRERRIITSKFWTEYFRRRNRQRQLITLVCGVWCLFVNDQPAGSGTLDECLIKADLC